LDTHENEISSDLDEIRRAGSAVQKDIKQLVNAIRRERSNLERKVQERPLLALGAAFGVGFVLGGGLASRIGGWLLVSGAKLIAAQAVRQFTAQLGDGEPVEDEYDDRLP